MQKPSPKEPTPVSLEDLLRLKRHEKPDPRFWDSFQAELHQKTLGTLVRREFRFIGLLKGTGLRLAPVLPLAAAALFVTALYLHEHFVAPSFEQKPQEVAVANPLPQDFLNLPEHLTPADFDTSLSTARYVVGAMNSRDNTSVDRGFTEVHAANRMSAGFNSRVQYVSGGLAASTIGGDSGTSVY